MSLLITNEYVHSTVNSAHEVAKRVGSDHKKNQRQQLSAKQRYHVTHWPQQRNAIQRKPATTAPPLSQCQQRNANALAALSLPFPAFH